MARKRKVSETNKDTSISHTRTKRTKYTLDYVKLPELTQEGVVLVTGQGDFGQLGLGPDVLEKGRPALVNLEKDIVDIYAGGMHTVCVTKDGKVLTFGCNDEGALGREAKDEAEFTAGEVKLPGKVIQVSAGDSHTTALLDDGRVFAWGTFRDSHGNMGMSSRGNEREPFEILKDQHIVKIASGDNHIVFLTNYGEVWTCGCAEQGQLGRTTERGSNRNARNYGIEKLLQPAPISLKPSLKLHFDNIWAGNYCTFAKVADKNDVYVFGLNNYNQIGLKKIGAQFLPKKSEDFSKYSWEHISSGLHHTIGLTTEGRVYAIGRNHYGRLGLGKDCEDAQVLTEVRGLTDKKVVNTACGSATSFAVTSEGELYGWGLGTSGQLGIGEEDDLYEPTHIISKQLNDKKVFRVSSGGQHTIILCSTTKSSSVTTANGNTLGDGQ